MTLKHYLIKHKISTAGFAKAGGWPFETARKWRQGIRIPRSKALLRITKITKGEVKPNDFYR